MNLKIVFLLTLITAVVINAQQSNSIEFIDTLANQKTGALGYKGSSANGHLFFETPGGKDMILEKGDLTVQGTITADKISGDGSGITNISGLSQVSDSIAKLAKEIKQKADSIHTHTADSLNWKAGSEGQVWKVGSNGKPGWGTDLQGQNGATTIAGIEGLADTLSSVKSQINHKADSAHTHKIDSLIWKAGSQGQVWKVGSNGKPGWATDEKTTTFPDSVRIAHVADSTKKIPLIDSTKLSSNLKSKINSIDNKIDASNVYSRDAVDQKVATAVDAITFLNYDNPVVGYYTVTNKNYSVRTIDIIVPADGFIIVNATALVQCVSLDVPDTKWAISADITLDQTTIQAGYGYDIWGIFDAGISVPFSQTLGFPVTKGTHTIRLLFSIGYAGTYKVWKPSMTCFFSQKSM